MNNDKLKILISGGGTGGHIFPALAIAGEIKHRHQDANILFVGAENRMEMEKVPAAGYKIIGLPISGFDRKNIFKNIKVLFRLFKSMNMAKDILKDFKPDIAIGVGGYASGPMLKAAQKKGIPTLIQEQNSYAGVTNKLLAEKADAICVAYEGLEKFFPASKIVLTGNPIRSNLLNCHLSQQEAKTHYGLDQNKLTVLVIGGSLGARTINNSIKNGLERISKENNIQFIWQTGKYYDEDCKNALAESPAKNVKQMAFVNDMDIAYKAADLVVSRAGASSISELQLLGKPCILVPSPNVAEDHQTKNALALVNKSAAIMISDSESQEKLVNTVVEVIKNQNRLNSLAENISKMALRNAAEHIVDKVLEIISNKRT